MNRNLHMRVDLHQPLPQIRKLLNQNLRIERHGDKERSHTTLDRHQEDIGDLEADKEGEGYNYGGEGVAVVVGGLGEGDVEIGEERAKVGNEDGAHGEDGIDETFVDESINATVPHHCPGCLAQSAYDICKGEVTYLSGWDICLPVQGNVGESIFVDELNSPIKKTDEASQDAKEDLAHELSLRCLILLGNRACLAEELDNGNDQASKADTAKTVGH
jgi:hypothetical protein